MRLVPQVMEQTAWEIILLTCNLSSAYCTSLFTVRIEQIRKPLQRRIISFYAHSASTLLFVTIFGIVMPPSWQFVVLVHGITATAPVAFLIMCGINKWSDRRTKDLTVLVNELRRMQMALLRLDPLQSSEECMEWLNSVDNLRRREEAIAIAEFYGRNFWIFTFSNKAGPGRELKRARNLLGQGNCLLHPQKHLRGTMNFYQKKVLDFIYNMGTMSGLLGIWGMGDVGKSSLLKLVRDLPLKYDNRSFELLFVRAGIGCTPGQVQQAIATSMGLRLESNEESQAKIIKNYLRNKSFLLLLDDLWGYLDLEAVGIPLPLGKVWVWVAGGLYRQRKVVLTTRNMDLCHEMGCHLNNTIQMVCFSEVDAWSIYDCRVRENRLLPGKCSISVVTTQGKKPLPKKQSGNVVPHKQLPEEPSGGLGNIRGDKFLPKKLSSSSYTKTQLARPLPHSLFDGKPQQTQDGLPEMTDDAYKKVCKFIEATEPSQFLLEKAEPWLMGVCGVRGVGKTALLRLVCNFYRGNICFDHIIFVGAGTGCMVNNVQHAIAINLGLNWAMMSSLDELSRAAHISNYLKDKTFLLLLDDIREPLNWWYIGLPPLSSRRKIILATRSRAACALMGCLPKPNTIEMNCLAERHDAWILFRDKVGLGIIDDHPQVHHLADQMVSRCGGLPLALCALGRAMSNKKDPREWRSAHGQFMAVRLEPSEIDEKAVTAILNAL